MLFLTDAEPSKCTRLDLKKDWHTITGSVPLEKLAELFDIEEAKLILPKT